MIRFRRNHPVFRRRTWFEGRRIRGIEDLAWFRPDGQEMTDDDWEAGHARAVAVFFNGASIIAPDAYGERIVDDNFLVLLNASDGTIPWTLPGREWGRRWTVDLDTSDHRPGSSRTVNRSAKSTFEVIDRSMVVLRSTQGPSRHPAHARTTRTEGTIG